MGKRTAKPPSALPTRFLPPRASANRGTRFPHFMKLPLELRHNIYSNLLLSPTTVDVWSAQNRDELLTPCSCNRRLDVAILRTNKAVSREAAMYLYTTNTFTFMEPCDYHEQADKSFDKNPVLAWLDKIGIVNSAHILHLQLRIRIERVFADYYTGLIRAMSLKMINLTRIAIAAEQHKTVRVVAAHDSDSENDGNGEDTDDEHIDIDELALDGFYPDEVVWFDPDSAVFMGDSAPHVFKAYHVSAIPAKDRVQLGKALLDFKNLNLILLYGQHSKQKPSLMSICDHASQQIKRAQCIIQETHDTRAPRLAVPWHLEVAATHQWNYARHFEDKSATKSKLVGGQGKPTDDKEEGKDGDA